MNKIKNDIIAIDISKRTLEVRTDQKRFKTTNDSEGFSSLGKYASKLDHPLVVCEATAGYERHLMLYLHRKNIPVALINPSRIRAFARSEGVKAKTDRIDTKMILHFARNKQLTPTPAPDLNRQKIAGFMDRRSHLKQQLTKEKNRIQNCPSCIEASIRRITRILEKEIVRIEDQIRSIIASQKILSDLSLLFQQVRGVGEATSWSLIAYLSEIGHLKRNQIVALAGIAPYNQDSATLIKKRSIEGGRAKIRKCLYMATQTAAQYNPVIKPYVQALRERGKPYKCAIVAGMRKLLIHLHIITKNYYLSLA